MKVSMLFTAIGLVASAAAKDLELCKQPGFVNCVPLSSAFVCDNVIAEGGEFVSGRVTSFGSCDIFSQPSCAGTSNTVDTDGWSNFPFPVKSIRC
jgi:hypothetical protein